MTMSRDAAPRISLSSNEITYGDCLKVDGRNYTAVQTIRASGDLLLMPDGNLYTVVHRGVRWSWTNHHILTDLVLVGLPALLRYNSPKFAGACSKIADEINAAPTCYPAFFKLLGCRRIVTAADVDSALRDTADLYNQGPHGQDWEISWPRE